MALAGDTSAEDNRFARTNAAAVVHASVADAAAAVVTIESFFL